jgi:UDP-N-acetylmuramate dehydrogenase
MIKILENYDLKSINTFGVPATAKYFTEINSEEELQELFQSNIFRENKKLVLGGGSNILFTKDFNGLVILNKLKGMEILEEDKESVLIRAMAGEVWHDLIEFAVGKGYWGIENLSLVPGSVGAAPMQNIGAYGEELKNTLVNVETFSLETGDKRVFSTDECALGYRDSIFKNSLKGKYFISAITVKLSKKEKKNISYKILREYLESNKIEVKNPKDISDAVSAIRRSKLPDPKVLGNAGSFFKNVFVTKEELERLQKDFPDIKFFEEVDTVKIPAAWLIESLGWKGYREGNVGVHEKQALVLVNYGGATGDEVKNLAEKIIDSVAVKFGLKLSPEVNLI